MNIFVLHAQPREAAQALCDKHVPKMLLETAQLLCSAHPAGQAPYRRTHYNHPCARWVRQNRTHYEWLVFYGVNLAKEYTYRFERQHASQCVVEWCAQCAPPTLFRSSPTVVFVQAMPEKYRCSNAVKAYRRYYIAEKARFAAWNRGRKPPTWWPRSV